MASTEEWKPPGYEEYPAGFQTYFLGQGFSHKYDQLDPHANSAAWGMMERQR